MRSRSVSTLPAISLLGLGVGIAAGVAAGLLVAPMRGADMRRSLRSRADDAVDRGLMLLEEGRRAFRTRGTAPTPGTVPLAATLGEIAEMHSGNDFALDEARS